MSLRVIYKLINLSLFEQVTAIEFTKIRRQYLAFTLDKISNSGELKEYANDIDLIQCKRCWSKHFQFRLRVTWSMHTIVFGASFLVELTVVFLTAANHNVRNAHAVLMKRSYSVVGFRLTGWLNIVVFLPNVSVVI